MNEIGSNLAAKKRKLMILWKYNCLFQIEDHKRFFLIIFTNRISKVRTEVVRDYKIIRQGEI